MKKKLILFHSYVSFRRMKIVKLLILIKFDHFNHIYNNPNKLVSFIENLLLRIINRFVTNNFQTK